MCDSIRVGVNKMCEDQIVGHLAAWFKHQGFLAFKGSHAVDPAITA